MKSRLPQGNKSHVAYGARQDSVVKRYNGNGDPFAKCAREVAFYRCYRDAAVLPRLIGSGADWIEITTAPGVRIADLSEPQRRTLTSAYAEALVRLFAEAPEPNAAARRSCGATSARVTRDLSYSGIVAYRTASGPSDVLDALLFSLARVVLTRDVLAKLDWNSANAFAAGNSISAFIDFEQTFIGTREMLTGAVLLNPDFDAALLYKALARGGMASVGPQEIVHYMNLAFARQLLDSYERSGRAWSAGRLEEAYRRHVFARHIDVVAGGVDGHHVD